MRILSCGLMGMCMIGCSSDAGDEPGAESEAEGEVSSSSEWIGEDGGSVGTGDVVVEIPPGALDESVLITVTQTGELPPPEYEEPYSTVYRFEPTGLDFAKSVTVTFTLESSDIPNPTIFWSNSDNSEGGFDPLPSTRDLDRVSAQTSHFSECFVAIDCDDNNDCTDDSFVPGTGCANTPMENGTACTTTDDKAGTCQEGTCLSSFIRTLAYHQTTTEEIGVDTTKGFAVSDDGNHAVFIVSHDGQYDVTVVNADGSGRAVLDTITEANWIQGLSMNGDGSLVTYQPAGGPLKIAGPSTSPTTLTDVTGTDALSPRFARDPSNPLAWKVYFVLEGDLSSPTRGRGVYSVNADGSGQQQLLSADDVAALTGVTADVPFPHDTLGGTLDVSSDGTRFVTGWSTASCTGAGQSDFIIAATADGVTKRVLMGPLTTGCGVQRLGLSGDGTTVAYSVDMGTGENEIGVIEFDIDGAGTRVLDDILGGLDNNWGLSDDGAHLLSSYAIYNTDGSGVFDIAVLGGRWSTDPTSTVDCYFGIMNGAASRIMYVVANTEHRFVATMDINPSTLGEAPAVSQASILPAVITRGGAAATVKAHVSTTGTELRVGSAVLLHGHEDTQCVDAEQVLLDDGTDGDATAADDIFTSNRISASKCATTTGARTVRLRAEATAEDGMRHATVVDFEPFAIE